MSLIKSIRKQLGLSVTPANNFTLTAEADNDTMKLARGNAGATTQDIMTVDAAGKPRFNQLAQSLSSTGYKVLEGGLIVQWGINNFPTIAAGGEGPQTTINLPMAFPTTVLSIATSVNDRYCTIGSSCSLTQIVLNAHNFYSGSITPTAFWTAIGY